MLNEDGEYSRTKYLSDPKLWSPQVVETYFDEESPRSDDRNLALDIRYVDKGRFILEGELETGLTLLSSLRGRGLQYTTDRLSPSFRSEVDALGLFVRHTATSQSLRSESLLRWRQDTIEATDLYSGGGQPFVQLRDATSQGLEASYQLDWHHAGVIDPEDKVTLIGGARYQSGFRPDDWDRIQYGTTEEDGIPTLDFSQNLSLIHI